MKIAVYKVVFLVVYIGLASAILNAVGWIDWSPRFYAVVLVIGVSAGLIMRALFERAEDETPEDELPRDELPGGR